MFITKTPFYLLWNKAITITINWHNAITHITISNIIIWHPSFSQEQNRPTAMCTTLAALRYIFYHILLQSSTFFWKFYEHSGNIPHYTTLQKTSLCKSAKAYFYTVLLVILAVSYMVCFILRKRGPHHGKTKESTASF